MLREVVIENQKLFRLVVLVYCLLVVVGVVFIHPFGPFVMGLTFGTLVSVLNFCELALTFKRAILMPSYRAQKFAVMKYLMRYGLTVGVMVVSFLSPSLNPFGTILGLLIIKGVLYSTQLSKNKSNNNQESLRKEE